MNIAQFIILTVLFLIGIFCQMYNFLIRMKQENMTKIECLLQISAIISLTTVYGLGVIGTFAGVYK